MSSTRSAALLAPPVTKATLSDFDVNKIVNNPKLRHDINFDPDLHFRPNLDGEKGRRKSDFWGLMQKQLEAYVADREQFDRELGDSEWCLPATLKAIRGILEILVPERDRSSVEETFNVELLMQQLRKGVADLEKLALWSSPLLKRHSPMRDNWVNEMVSQLSSSHGHISTHHGIQNLLGTLEAMKLNVANHEIRCLRPLLIDDTVHFEQNFFIQKHRISKIDAQFPDFASILAHVYARDLSLNPPESVGFLESLSQGGAIPEQRPRLGLDPKQAHWRSPAPDIFSRIKRLLSRSMRNSSWIVPFISYAIQGASASPIGSTPPKNYNSELWHLLQTFFNGNWDHLIGLPLLFFMLKFLDKGLFRNEDRSATSAFLMVGIAIGLAYAGNAQDFEASHIVLWSMFCLGVVTYYVGPTLRRLSLGRLWATLIVLPGIATAIGIAFLCAIEEGRYANKYKFATGLAIPCIAFSAYIWSALYDLWNYLYPTGFNTRAALQGHLSNPLELLRSIATFCIGIFVNGPQPAPPTDVESGQADTDAPSNNTVTSNDDHGPPVDPPTETGTPQREQNTNSRRSRRGRRRGHSTRPE